MWRALLLFSVTTVSGVARAAGPTDLKLVAAQMAGSGCPAATLEAKLVGNESVELSLPTFSAATFDKKPLAREACNITLQLSWSGNGELAPISLTSDVKATLQPGAKGDAALSYHFQGKTDDAEAKQEFPGNAASQKVTLAPEKHFSECGQKATLVMRLALKTQQIGAKKASELKVSGPATLALELRPCGS